MRSLSKLICVNAPDLVLFVGEALVGNEAVDQVVKFNAALADHSIQENPHLIDGIVLTKFDTIDDKVFIRKNKRTSKLFLSTYIFISAGGVSHLHDLHHRTAHCFCRHRTDIHRS